MDVIVPLFMGLSLASVAGLRAFLPLLALAFAAHFGLIHLNGHFAWLQSDTALFVLCVAAIVELIGDKIPVVDHALDALQTIVRPAAGVLAVASTQSHMDPVMAGVLGLVLGAPLAGTVHVAKGGLRLTSSATTMGFANPLLSFAEDGIATALTLVSLFAPVVSFVIVAAVIYFVVSFWLRTRRRQKSSPA